MMMMMVVAVGTGDSRDGATAPALSRELQGCCAPGAAPAPGLSPEPPGGHRRGTPARSGPGSGSFPLSGGSRGGFPASGKPGYPPQHPS